MPTAKEEKEEKPNQNETETETDLEKQVQDVSASVLATPNLSVSEALNRILTPYIGTYFQALSGKLRDDAGSIGSGDYGAIICTKKQNADDAINIDNVAVIIDTYEHMGVLELDSAFQKISDAKSLKRSPGKESDSDAETQMKMGVIFVKNTTLSLDQISQRLDKLCENVPAELWPDIVAVHNQGIVGYTAHFPGDSSAGDFLLPAEKPDLDSIPPIYVVRTVKPAAHATFNMMLALILMRLKVFAPSTVISNIGQVRGNVDNIGMVHTGYQYNLQGQLVPVPPEFRNDVYVPPAPLFIEDNQGKALGTIQFLPWQEGGVILVKGHFPLELFYVFLKQIIPSLDFANARIIKRNGLQISYVMPMDKNDFIKMVRLFEQRSNMRVRSHPEQFIIQTIGNEGSSSPFVARFMPGMLKLRDMVFFDSSEKERFDKSYGLLHSNLSSARDAAKEILDLWKDHSEKVKSGSIVRLSDRAIHINEEIDRELKKELDSFVNTAWRTLKNSLQNLARELGIDLGFFFKDDNSFAKGLSDLRKTDPDFADYLLKARRAWTNQLAKIRNDDVEHGTWNLPKVGYKAKGNDVVVEEPTIVSMPVTEFVDRTLNQMMSFVEEVTAHCLQRKMTRGINFSEIPVTERNESLPERFRPTLQGLNIWRISYSEAEFDKK